jgi:NADPH-dependent 2,4-dienoyl-CoA reductase/sulfur reductase-like enzyme/rhodanese-related sulfurtransferase
MSAATRARRLDDAAEIIIFEKGPHVSFANCGLPYFIGGTIRERDSLLVQTPEGLRKRFRLDVRVRSEVTSIDRTRKELSVLDLSDGRTCTERYDKLILAPGADPIRPPIPGVRDPAVHCLRNIDDMDRIAAAVEAERSGAAIVIGGGFIGLEMAENLVRRGWHVALAEMLPQVMPALDPEMAEPIHQHLRDKGIELHLSNAAVAVEREGKRLVVRLQDGTALKGSFAILGVGLRPNTRLAEEAGLEIGPSGGIKVDGHLRTSDPDIYAVGDAVEVTDYVTGRPTLLPLAGPANRQGRIAANNVCGRESTFRGVQGTAIVRIFDLAAANTGANEKTLRKLGIAHQKVYVHPFSHADYYPGASQMSLKLLFSTEDGRVLGAQVVGTEGVDKRVDVLATAVQARMTVYDLEEAELVYAPQFSTAKDAINMAGFVAANYLRGDVDIVHVDQLGGDTVVLDVRTAGEYLKGHIPGALNIPVDDLRQRLDEVPRGKLMAVYCGVGLRSYIACRILKQKGFKVANVPGGYKTYQHYKPPRQGK